MVAAGELAAIPTAATVALRLAERVYEVLAVTPQIRDLVDTTTQASKKLRNARILRRQRSRLLNQLEKTIIEDAFVATEKAIDIVARIIEPARADMDISGGIDVGRVGLGNSIVFVIRDASKILVSHQKLMQASSDLNMAIITLNSKTGERSPVSPDAASPTQSRLPTYHESQAMHRSRERNLRRRESAFSLRPPLDTPPITPVASSPSLSVPNVPEMSGLSSWSSRRLPSSSSNQDFDKIAVSEAVWSPDAPSPVHAFDVPPIVTTASNTNSARAATASGSEGTATTTSLQTKPDTILKGRARSKAWLIEWF